MLNHLQMCIRDRHQPIAPMTPPVTNVLRGTSHTIANDTDERCV